MSPETIFKNAPKLSEHEANKHFNERRIALVAHIEDFVTSHPRFQGKEVSITFSHRGVSSLVSIIETGDEKLVLKVPLSRTGAGGEAQFLKVWEQAGVTVPHVIEDGILDNHPYILMEYIDAPILTDGYTHEELEAKGIYAEMGRTLRRMHAPEAEGYGRVIEGKAEFVTFSDWLRGSDMEARIAYVKEHNLLSDEHGSISKAFETLQELTSENPVSSYCHDDFGPSNIFATTPMTVFDPNPRYQNGYLDLARSMVIQISQGVVPSQLRDGYFEGASCNEEALHAAMIVNAHMKFSYWHRVNKVKQIQRVQEYLAARV